MALGPVERAAAALQVRAGAEAAPRAGDHDGAHVVVRVRGVQRLDQLAAHRGGERVQALGPVERDREDVVLDLVEDLLELHAPLLASGERGL
jgi:hypothetical protein